MCATESGIPLYTLVCFHSRWSKIPENSWYNTTPSRVYVYILDWGKTCTPYSTIECFTCIVTTGVSDDVNNKCNPSVVVEKTKFWIFAQGAWAILFFATVQQSGVHTQGHYRMYIYGYLRAWHCVHRMVGDRRRTRRHHNGYIEERYIFACSLLSLRGWDFVGCFVFCHNCWDGPRCVVRRRDS